MKRFDGDITLLQVFEPNPFLDGDSRLNDEAKGGENCYASPWATGRGVEPRDREQ